MDRHFEYLFKSAAADQKFVETRVWRCDVCDDQRSSLMIQLQSVSESLFTLIICTDLLWLTMIWAMRLSLKYHLILSCWFILTSVSRVTESPSITDTETLSASTPRKPEDEMNRQLWNHFLESTKTTTGKCCKNFLFFYKSWSCSEEYVWIHNITHSWFF